MIEANTKCTYCDSDFQWNYELDVNEHWMNSALKIVVVCVQQTNVHAAIHWEKWMRASQEHRKKLILNRMCTSNARHNHTEIITQWWEREKKHRSIKNDKFISYPLLNSNLIFFFCFDSVFVSLCVCKTDTDWWSRRQWKRVYTHCTKRAKISCIRGWNKSWKNICVCLASCKVHREWERVSE